MRYMVGMAKASMLALVEVWVIELYRSYCRDYKRILHACIYGVCSQVINTFVSGVLLLGNVYSKRSALNSVGE